MIKFLRAILMTVVLTIAAHAGNLPPVQTVFVIVLENHIWSEFKGNTNAPFLNETLLPMSSYCEQYYNPPGLHPSEPNYLWLEAGTNFGILDDNDPAVNHQNSTNHLVTQLRRAGISWKTYQEDIVGDVVPMTGVNGYVPRHNPFVYFRDTSGTNNPHYAYALAHIRPYTEFAGDLTNNSVARYNFITPNLCHDGHDVCAPQTNSIRQTDDWLAGQIPKILRSAAYSNNGALFITWDEGEGGIDGPIGMILLSPLARGGGYFNNIHYTHSSFVRTMQEIFGVSPWLGDAVYATDLSDLFMQLAIDSAGMAVNGGFTMHVSGVLSGRTNFIEASTNFWSWIPVSTNKSSSNSFFFTDYLATNHNLQFYRVRQAQ
ncbi:MAG: alkaline phosphatase family protein [Limisphaerales bacterium]